MKVEKRVGAGDFVYWIMFIPERSSGGAIPRYVCHSEEHLKDVLSDLEISPTIVDKTIQELNESKHSLIPHVSLTENQINRYGLRLSVFESIQSYISAL
jgi:hypothetical protein